MMMTYKWLSAWLGKRTQKKLCHNTWALRLLPSLDLGIKFHQTVILRYLRNGRVVINTNGWRTVTTMRRVAMYTDRALYSNRGTWYWRNGVRFTDGDSIRGGEIRCEVLDHRVVDAIVVRSPYTPDLYALQAQLAKLRKKKLEDRLRLAELRYEASKPQRPVAMVDPGYRAITLEEERMP